MEKRIKSRINTQALEDGVKNLVFKLDLFNRSADDSVLFFESVILAFEFSDIATLEVDLLRYVDFWEKKQSDKTQNHYNVYEIIKRESIL